jgi:hypothetical protein
MYNKYIGLGIMLVAILTATFCFAAMLKVELPDLVNQAPLIVMGKVVDLKSDWLDGPGSTIFTIANVKIKEVLKGNVAVGKTLLIKVYGGEKNGIGLDVSTEPKLKAGETIIAFLKKENNEYRPVQLLQGIYHLEGNNILENNLVVDEFIKQIKSNVK